MVKSKPQAEVEESEEEEEEVVHQAPEAAVAAAPLKLGLKLGRCSNNNNSTEKEVSQGSCSTITPTVVITPPPAAIAVAAGSSSSSPPSTKKQRVTSPSSAAAGGGYQNPAPPCHCQVEGCTTDLSSAKDYHRRHKVCEMHSKASKAITAGCEQRFCQQCSRCRRRLAGHNERRCKPHPESSSVVAATAAAIHLSFNCRTFSYS